MVVANRSPSGTSADPVLRIYSSDEAEADDYFEMYHDQTDANIDVGTGDIKLQPSAVGDVTLFEDTDVDNADAGKKMTVHRKAAEGDSYLDIYNSASGDVLIEGRAITSRYFQIKNIEPGGTATRGYISFNYVGDVGFYSGNAVNAGWVMNAYGRLKRIDFGSNSTWTTYNLGALGVGYAGGTGLSYDLDVNGTIGGDSIEIQSVTASTFIEGANLTSDPCGTYPEGGLFYNDTSDYYCFCNGAGDDVQMHSPATACF